MRGEGDPARGRLLRAELGDGEEHRQALTRAPIGPGGPQESHRDRLGWCRRGIRGGIEPLKALARKFRAYLPGLLAHCLHPLHTSALEGIKHNISFSKPGSRSPDLGAERYLNVTAVGGIGIGLVTKPPVEIRMSE